VKKMKHRSVGAFVILAAFFLVVPQASRDLLDATAALGSHARSHLLRAFVGFNAGGAVTAAAFPSSPPPAASCQGATASPETARKGARDGRDARPSSKARGPEASESPLELAMILDPAAAGLGAPAPPLEAEFGALDLGRAPRPRARELNSLREFAMIIPPDMAVPPPPAPPRRAPLRAEVAAAPAAQSPSPLVYLSSLRADEVAKLRAGVGRFKFEVVEEVREEGEAAAAVAVERVQKLKVRRELKKTPAAVGCGAPQFVREPACPTAPAEAETVVQFVTVSE
jgi:hypothetical protein